jgi:voltage-gated potassium channel
LKSSLGRFYRAVIFFFSVLILGTLGYIVAGWSPLDAFFMMVITIFSVGYGEVQPLTTPALKLYTIVVIFAGTGSAFYLFGTVIQMITEGELKQALGASRMSREIDHIKNHTIVCGFGRLGRIISRQLHEAHHKFVVMDTSPERIQDAKDIGYNAYLGNALDERDLRAVHAERATVLATVLPSDADNVFITLSARNLNPDITIIARGEQGSTEGKLRQAGANHVIIPAAIGGKLIANLILHPAGGVELQVSSAETLDDDLRDMGLKVRILTVGENNVVLGQPVDAIAVAGRDPFIVVGVRADDGRTTHGPHSDYLIRAGDQVVAIGPHGDIPAIMLRAALIEDRPLA